MGPCSPTQPSRPRGMKLAANVLARDNQATSGIVVFHFDKCFGSWDREDESDSQWTPFCHWRTWWFVVMEFSR